MKSRRVIKGISAALQALIGAVFVSPLISHPEKVKENGVAWAMVFIGAILIVVGSTKLYALLKMHPTSGESEPLNSAEVNNHHILATVGRLLIKMSYLVLALTAIGTIYMAVFIGSGGASGIPIAFGIMLAGILSAIGRSCK